MSWRSIPGYEGVYAVSDDGQVMSMNYCRSGLPGLLTQSAISGIRYGRTWSHAKPQLADAEAEQASHRSVIG
jgi:hypothetical protein